MLSRSMRPRFLVLYPKVSVLTGVAALTFQRERRTCFVRLLANALESLQSGAFTPEPFLDEDLERCREIIAKYRDLKLGLADAAVMATAERLGTFQVLTVDERDFRAVVSKKGRPFHLLPTDGLQ
jgi:uncharacterized protein